MRRIISAIVCPIALAAFACGGNGGNGSADSAERTANESQDLYGLGSLGGVWPNGVVPVCFTDLVNNGSLRAQIPNILGLSWSWAAGITFTGFGACGGGNQVAVSFQAGSNGVTDALGYGQRSVTLISNDTPDLTHFTYEVIHEFGHALGFAHEMQRPDNWNGNTPINCPPFGGNPVNQFTPQSGGIYLTPTFDPNSIMNYCTGFQTFLSAGDIAGVSRSDAYGLPFLQANPKTITLIQGDAAGVDVTWLTQNLWAGPQGINGETTPINVSVTGLPKGVEALLTDTYGTHMNFSAFAGGTLGTTVVAATGRGADAQGNVETHTALLQINVVAASAPRPPGCTSMVATCNSEYFPPGYAPTPGYQTLVTVNGTCASNATSFQEIVNGNPVGLAPFTGNASYPPVDSNVFDISGQSAGSTTWGAAIGSRPVVQACITNQYGLTACDPPTGVLIPDCCVPMTCDGLCGDISDGCGTELHCGGCGTGLACVNNFCEDTSAQGKCEAAGGTWEVINGKGRCIKPPPPRCGGKGQPVCQ